MAEQFVTANKTTESPEGGLSAVDVRGAPIAVASAAGAYYAFDDTLEKRAGQR
jgi:nitrite reductase/ring-hydroxylating ferredoxin subunit